MTPLPEDYEEKMGYYDKIMYVDPADFEDSVENDDEPVKYKGLPGYDYPEADDYGCREYFIHNGKRIYYDDIDPEDYYEE